MKRQYLGDALDFWKAGLLSLMRRSSSRRVKLVPLFTDAWTQEEIDTYARLLGGSRDDVLLSDIFTRRNRALYFAKLSGTNEDLFVDPDTGIAPGSAGAEHITGRELSALAANANLVAVYQHAPRGGTSPGWVGLRARRCDPNLRWIGYESVQVGMVFVSRSPERIAALGTVLARELGAAANARIVHDQI